MFWLGREASVESANMSSKLLKEIAEERDLHAQGSSNLGWFPFSF